MDREPQAESTDRYDFLSCVMSLGLRNASRARRFRIVGLLAMGGWLIVPTLFWAGCETREPIREFFRSPTPHEAYLLSLGAVGLTETALGRDWLAAANDALDHPLAVISPYQEEGFFPPEDPQALGIRISMERGQRLTVEVELDSGDPTRLFLDVYRVAPDPTRFPVPVMATEVGEEPLEFEPSSSDDYIIRLQPEVLRGGRYRLTLRADPSLIFPVAGYTSRSIQSFFGDPRDAGRREHHGVDVFARRGTPVLAAADGYITAVNTTPIGGRVVWQRDSSGRHTLYYAHLERQLVRSGQRVRAGDTLGLVGNTGNARTTPPHLHFGIYRRRRGPVDPWYYLLERPTQIAELTADLGVLGGWVRVRNEEIRLRLTPTLRGTVLGELSRYTVAMVMAGAGEWYRVRLPDGQSGYIAARLTEPVEEPLRTEILAGGEPILMSPDPLAPVVATAEDEQGISVLGSFRDFLYVMPLDGRVGWVAAGGLLDNQAP